MKDRKSTEIPDWAKKVQAEYQQKFKVGDIVHYHDRFDKKPKLGVITGSSAARGDVEVPVKWLKRYAVMYTIWFKEGESGWYDEAELTPFQQS